MSVLGFEFMRFRFKKCRLRPSWFFFTARPISANSRSIALKAAVPSRPMISMPSNLKPILKVSSYLDGAAGVAHYHSGNERKQLKQIFCQMSALGFESGLNDFLSQH